MLLSYCHLFLLNEIQSDYFAGPLLNNARNMHYIICYHIMQSAFTQVHLQGLLPYHVITHSVTGVQVPNYQITVVVIRCHSFISHQID